MSFVAQLEAEIFTELDILTPVFPSTFDIHCAICIELR